MLRSLFIYLSKAGWARRIIMNWGVAQRMSSRFVAGEHLDQAVEAIKGLNDRGINATLDHLGENVTSPESAVAAAEEVLNILDRIAEEGIRSGVSIKLSQIGLVLDKELCENNLMMILTRAQEHEIYVRIDMEDSSLVEQTLSCYFQALEQGFDGTVGIVIQSYLYRSDDDVRRILAEEGTIRLCKGAYKEPPSVAFPRKHQVDQNFDHLTTLLLDRSLEVGESISPGGVFPPIPALATHDEGRIDFAVDYAEKIGLSKDKLEFQMLYGIRTDLQNELVEAGYPVRVYVPYGQEWYPYFTRRLAERPANLWFFISNYFRG
jgi:proline dehydrogenase